MADRVRRRGIAVFAAVRAGGSAPIHLHGILIQLSITC